MINLRYHIVSLVAVFLAIALGIVMGSTVIDRAIVDGLQNRVESVNKRANGIDSENRTLRGQLDVFRGFADQARNQLMNARISADFQPSPEAYAPSVAVWELGRTCLAMIGVTAEADLDLYVAVVGGLVDAQLANDPGGDRYARQLDRAVGMLADHFGL